MTPDERDRRQPGIDVEFSFKANIVVIIIALGICAGLLALIGR